MLFRAQRGNGNLIFTCDENNSLFRRGDSLFFHKGSPFDADCMECFLESDDERYIEVSAHSRYEENLGKQPDEWIADEGFLDLSDLYLGALFDVAEKDIGRNRILPLLIGHLKSSVDVSEYMAEYQHAIQNGFNASQSECAAQAMASDLAYLIQGPPGTGKTFVIAHITRTLVAAGERVFITSFTHRAINNVLNKIFDLDPGLPVCKIGVNARANDLKVENFASFSDSGFGKFESGYVIGATPFATRSSRLSGVHFDTVIFDEASQVTLPIAILAMLAGNRYIFVGDDKQLPPVVATPMPSDSLSGTSIFGFLSGRGYETMLDTTYRMNETLTRWPSKAFYMEKLVPEVSVKNKELQIMDADLKWPQLLNPKYPAVFADLRHSHTTIRSFHEAGLVAQIIMDLIKAGIKPSEIGVVSPYRRQGREIRRYLKRLSGNAFLLRKVVIDTVERMQGQEREVVLVSFATSDPTFAERLCEFFFQPNRLNVTITRARTKLIVVGSSEMLKAAPRDPDMKAYVRNFRDFLGYCKYFDISEAL